MKLLRLGLLAGSLIPSAIFGQIFFSNGADISITPGGILHTNGGLECSGTTSLSNEGQIRTTKLSTLPEAGSFTIGSATQVTGSGNYDIEQDWVINGGFNASMSTVTLYGNTEQFITSSNGTSPNFYNLVLTGTGTGVNRRKTLQNIDASVTGGGGTLTLNDRELATETQTFVVMNTSPTAVSYNTTPGNEGFVSSLSPGYFIRLTNSTNPYIFPTGSSVGTTRFRPIEITPVTTDFCQYNCRLNNFDANTQNFDRSQTDGKECNLNPVFFHSIERPTGTTPAAIKLFYIPSTDGNWSGIAQWVIPTLNWNDIASDGTGTSGIFTTKSKSNWDFTDYGHPYILSNLRPEPPVLTCPTVCENSTGNVFTLTGTTTNYQWTFPSNGTITSGQGTNTVNVSWTTGIADVSAVAIDANGCTSLPGTCAPTISPNPTVQFTYTEDGNTFIFTDQTVGSETWDWSFGDGGNSVVQNPTHTYNGGDVYTVTLNVTNDIGCVGSATKIVEIFHDMTIPNVITPNGDGDNDQFTITTTGLKSYDIIIVNRWGNQVFSTNDPNTHWDGKINGTDVVDGVYFYTIKASTSTKDLKFQGNVTVIKN